MIEFKQIIGRGTRLFENKDYFTVYDFVGAHEHFSDPEWDGDPLAPDPCKKCGERPCVCEKEPRVCGTCEQSPCVCEKAPTGPCPDCGEVPCTCNQKKPIVRVKLADGKARQIQHMMMTTFWHPDGTPISSDEFLKHLFGDLPTLFKNEAELRKLWSRPATRKRLLTGLEEKGYGSAQLRELAMLINAEKSDIYDVLSYVAFKTDAITRSERVESHRAHILNLYPGKQQEFLEFVLRQYVKEGVGELDDQKLPTLIELMYHTVQDAVMQLGRSPEEIRKMFTGFQEHLYAEATAV